jgi:hypothetical protein
MNLQFVLCPLLSVPPRHPLIYLALRPLRAASPSFDFSPAPTETEIAAHQLRKTLSSLAAHDALAKRIRGLPAEKGSAQARLQMGIAVGAGTFMQGVLPMLQVRIPSSLEPIHPVLHRMSPAESISFSTKSLCTVSPQTQKASSSRIYLLRFRRRSIVLRRLPAPARRRPGTSASAATRTGASARGLHRRGRGGKEV